MHGKDLDGNAEAIEAWNTVLFDKFCQFRDILVTGLGIHGEVAIERAGVKPGLRVVDVGCGFGDTAIALSRIVGDEGEVTGVDAASRFIDAAKREAAEAGAKNAHFRVADVESDDLGGPYDIAFSRMGTMFFANPVAALRNIRKSLVSKGRLSMAVWRRKDENPFLSIVEARVLEMVTIPPKTEEVTCGPGPFSMASPDVVSAQLLKAGFVRPMFERFDGDVFIGHDLDAAIDFSLTVGPAGEVMRLAGEEAKAKRPEIVAAVRELLAPFARDKGVYAGSSSWIVTADVP